MISLFSSKQEFVLMLSYILYWDVQGEGCNASSRQAYKLDVSQEQGIHY